MTNDLDMPKLTDNGIKYADVSTCHMAYTDGLILDEIAVKEPPPGLAVIKYPEGWFMFVGTDLSEFDAHIEEWYSENIFFKHFSPEFVQLLRRAVHQGFTWIRFDADAKKYAGIKEFDW